ncbi:hypothetical protein FDG2_0434 [Candidatus Protofrankia californiensis]|uniref:DUF2637 domain-containing protein n=1 Tax=Candidatus Protofrankia californiensis TaxID=1839754 RepID=A0A1C3NTL0_9ACTN|nr:hypothetical protein FDG2_0434 [Candidatus Protofrankia californiensis]
MKLFGRWEARSVAILAGTYGVIGASAALSFESLRGLGELVGYSPRLANGLPISIDLYAAVVSLIWLGPGSRSTKIRRWAKQNTVFSAALSIACNALYHALLAGKLSTLARNAAGAMAVVDVNAAIVVAVGAIPPIILVLVVHLLSLLAEDRQPPEVATDSPRRPVAPRAADPPVVAVGRLVPPPTPSARPVAEIPTQKRPELPAPTPVSPPVRPPAPVTRKPAGAVAPVKPASDRKAAALAELARRDVAGEDLSRPGFNEEMAERLGVSLRSVEGYKTAYRLQKAGGVSTSEASG